MDKTETITIIIDKEPNKKDKDNKEDKDECPNTQCVACRVNCPYRDN